MSHKLASINPAQIDLWFTGYPGANVAIKTGPPSQIYVLDVDKKSRGLESLTRLQTYYGLLPKTVEVATGGGGRHYWFKSPTTLRGRIGFLPGLDFRGQDQLCVAPPSQHSSGQEYTWINSYWDTPIAPLPTWLMQLVRKPNAN